MPPLVPLFGGWLLGEGGGSQDWPLAHGEVVPGFAVPGDALPGAGVLFGFCVEGLLLGVALPGFGAAVPGVGAAVPGVGAAVPGAGVALPGVGFVLPGEAFWPGVAL